jgi:2-polyprenyl-6-methoxyphenol hydroxylase-like FAD-dependent oxidoreductase
MVDVLVIGAGPTGLTLAAELLRRGASVRIVDKLGAPSQLSKAIGVHARTLEILEPLGATAELLERGVKLGGVSVFAGDKTLVDARLDELDTRFPFLLALSQADTEAILTRRLEALGGRVDRGLDLVGLEQNDEQVTALLRSARRDTSVTARWIVGCDGAHSSVRRLLGIDFAGKGYDDHFLLGDVQVDGDLARDRVTTFFHAEGAAAFFPIPDDRVRVMTSNAGEGADPSLADLQAAVDLRTGKKLRLHDDRWRTRFQIHCRQVPRYRDRRAFLAGDAAHIHSPVGGQGMNTGIQDAHNLAWKLALVAAGKGGPKLLDSYDVERHGVGAAVLRATDVATRFAMIRAPIARAIRDSLARFLSSLELVQQRLARNAAEIDLSYRGSPIIAESRTSLLRARLGPDTAAEEPSFGAWRAFAAAPAAGERAPDRPAVDDKKHTVLLFDGRAQTPDGYTNLSRIAKDVHARFGELACVKVVVAAGVVPPGVADADVLHDDDGELEHRYGAHAECAYVIRPDLYIGFRCQPADDAQLIAHLQSVLG